MTVRPTARTMLPALAVVGFSALVTVALLYIAASGALKAGIVIVGAALLVGGAYLSGNSRLFALWGLIITLPFDLSYRIGTVYEKLGGETSFRFEVSDIFWVMLLYFLVRDLMTGARRGVRVPKVAYVWIAIMALGMLAVVMGPYRLTALHETVRMFKVLLLFLVVVNELERPGRFEHVVAALATAVIIQAAAAVLQYIHGAPLGLKILGESDVIRDYATIRSSSVLRVGAFMIHPNPFAIFLATTLPLMLATLLVPARGTVRLLCVAAIVLGVPALILTLSRAGWLVFFAAAVATVAMILKHPVLRRRVILPLVGASVVSLIAALVFFGPITSRIFDSTNWSAQGREEWIGDALRMSAARPLLGWGLNSYVFAVPPFTRLGARGARDLYRTALLGGVKFVPAVHNAYLTWLAETGVIGLAFHLALFVVLIRVGWMNLRVRNDFLYALNAACLAGIASFLIEANFSNSLRANGVLREFWVLAAIVMGVHYWRLHNEPAKRPLLAQPPAGVATGAGVPAGNALPGPT